MACKIVNLIACIVYVIALFLILFSFEPKKMGGIYKLSKKADDVWGNVYYPGEMLIHPFYISWTGEYKMGSGADYELEEVNELSCGMRFGSTRDWNTSYMGGGYPGYEDGLLNNEQCSGGQAAAGCDAVQNTIDTAYGAMSMDTGLTEMDHKTACDAAKKDDGGDCTYVPQSKLPCIVSILSATRASKYSQRRYANYAFGAGWDWMGYQYKGYAARSFFTTDYNLNTGATGAADAYLAQLAPNIWATQDAVFFLLQISGFFLAFGMVFHFLAFLMGGFIWNYSACCCDFGVCKFIFNAIVWSGLSMGCYIISLAAFAAIFFMGEKNSDPDLDIKWSIGGALLLTGIVLSAVAISLASYQWTQDRKTKEDAQLDQAVDAAVRRASGQGPA
jgi:hypothetical protein